MRVEASDGFVVKDVSLLRRLTDGVILSIIEGKPGDYDPGKPRIAFVERRDMAGRTAWRQRLPGLPSRYWGPVVVAAKGPPGSPLIVVATFAPIDAPRDAAHGSIIAVDERSGATRITGTLRRPGNEDYVPEDQMGVDQAIMLPPDLVALVGGVGQGPFTWWIGLRRLNGTVVWDVLSRRSVGEIRDVRRLKDGFEISVLNLISDNGTTGPLLLRIDGAGRVTASVRFRRGATAPAFTPDGGLAYLVDGDLKALIVEDRLGNRRFAVSVPDAFHVMPCLDDGTYVLGRTGDVVLVSPDGKSAIAVAADVRVRPDGSLLVSRCDDQDDCRARTLSLFARQQ
jgi:hypothetical protein